MEWIFESPSVNLTYLVCGSSFIRAAIGCIAAKSVLNWNGAILKKFSVVGIENDNCDLAVTQNTLTVE